MAPPDRRRDVSLSPDQYRLLGEAIRRYEAGNHSWQAPAIIRLLAVTGARPSEIRALRWSEVDFDHGALRLLRQENAGRNLKTKKSLRPLPDCAAKLLRHIHETHSKHSEWVFPGRSVSAPVSEIKLAWTTILPDALKAIDEGKPLTLNGFRHAFKSLAHSMGVGKLTSDAITGHSLGKDASTGYLARAVVDEIARRESNRVANAIWSYLEGETNVVQFEKEGEAING